MSDRWVELYRQLGFGRPKVGPFCAVQAQCRIVFTPCTEVSGAASVVAAGGGVAAHVLQLLLLAVSGPLALVTRAEDVTTAVASGVVGVTFSAVVGVDSCPSVLVGLPDVIVVTPVSTVLDAVSATGADDDQA